MTPEPTSSTANEPNGVLRYRVDQLELRQSDQDRRMRAMEKSLERIESGLIYRGGPLADGIESLDQRFEKLARELDVRAQVEQALDDRNLRGASFRSKLVILIPTVAVAVLTVFALIVSLHA